MFSGTLGRDIGRSAAAICRARRRELTQEQDANKCRAREERLLLTADVSIGAGNKAPLGHQTASKAAPLARVVPAQLNRRWRRHGAGQAEPAMDRRVGRRAGQRPDPGALVLIEEPAPVLEEQPVIMLELERPQRQKAPPKRLSAVSGASVGLSPGGSPDRPSTSARPAKATGRRLPSPEPPPPVVDPQWRDRPQDRGPLAADRGRAGRGLGPLPPRLQRLEQRAHDARREGALLQRLERPAGHQGRPSPGFIGPIDERHWEVPEPGPP
jgi:hypothetical protein